MTIIIFILILAVLIFVHELGHFLAAKQAGVRVDEFALGFPPKIWSKKYKGTVYALNAIPFGGYVKIFGETPDEASLHPKAKDSFVNAPKFSQTIILIAGIVFNIVFAWILVSLALMIGFPTSTSYAPGMVDDARVVITATVAGGPAERAGILPGDAVVGIKTETQDIAIDSIAMSDSVELVRSAIKTSNNQPVTLSVLRDGREQSVVVVPQDGHDGPLIGVGLDSIGQLQLPFHKALLQGARMTGEMTRDVAVGLFTFAKNIFAGDAELSQVTGPVGIVGLVGDASHFGVSYLFGFTAFISLNLAVINLLPFPALDGGRILFVIIEAITRRPIKPKIANMFNLVGFLCLMFLMLIVTIHDVVKLF